jgi:hypothetical protein
MTHDVLTSSPLLLSVMLLLAAPSALLLLLLVLHHHVQRHLIPSLPCMRPPSAAHKQHKTEVLKQHSCLASHCCLHPLHAMTGCALPLPCPALRTSPTPVQPSSSCDAHA